MHTCTFYNSGNKVIAISSFAHKLVRGIAKCNPEDDFSLDKGKKLAAARCYKKIAAKKVKSAEEKLQAAKEALHAAMREVEYMTDYHFNAQQEFYEAETALENILAEL